MLPLQLGKSGKRLVYILVEIARNPRYSVSNTCGCNWVSLRVRDHLLWGSALTNVRCCLWRSVDSLHNSLCHAPLNSSTRSYSNSSRSTNIGDRHRRRVHPDAGMIKDEPHAFVPVVSRQLRTYLLSLRPLSAQDPALISRSDVAVACVERWTRQQPEWELREH